MDMEVDYNENIVDNKPDVPLDTLTFDVGFIFSFFQFQVMYLF